MEALISSRKTCESIDNLIKATRPSVLPTTGAATGEPEINSDADNRRLMNN